MLCVNLLLMPSIAIRHLHAANPFNPLASLEYVLASLEYALASFKYAPHLALLTALRLL